MWLAVDIGNTNTVVGLFDGSELQVRARLSTHPIITGDEFYLKVSGLVCLKGIEFKELDHILISSVVPEQTKVVREAFQELPTREIDSDWKFSFSIATDSPAQVGTDRLVNAEAVVRENTMPAIIVDSGTATTICAISSDRRYLGGAIMTGVQGAMEALIHKTAKLQSVDLIPPEKAIGSNTSDALRSGLLLGYSSMIEGMISRFKSELVQLGESSEPVVIATGGVAQNLKEVVRSIDQFDPDLTLRGMAYLNETPSA